MSRQEVHLSNDSTSSSESSSCSSRDSSPDRAPERLPEREPQRPLEREPERLPEPVQTICNKRKPKTHPTSSSSKRTRTEEKKNERSKKPRAKKEIPSAQKKVRGCSKVTARDIFGSDSEKDEVPNAGKKDELISYLYRRGSSGITKQFNPNATGSKFVDMKLYMCDEIENVTAMNRWRQAVVSLKMKIDDDNPAYRHLVKFLKEIKRNFKDCSVSFVSTPNQ